MLVSCFWHLVTGFWLLVARHWSLAAGHASLIPINVPSVNRLISLDQYI
jgi:hypothetical protein